MKTISNSINRNAIYEFSHIIKLSLDSNLADILLFGSVARGTYTAESNIDILVIVLNYDIAVKKTVIDAAVDINLKHDVVISPIVMSQKHFMRTLFKETLFYKSLQSDGISLLSSTSDVQ